MTHPSNSELALYAGGDLRFAERLRLRLHVGRCRFCREEVQEFREAGERLREEANLLPPDLQWERLADEMTANIHLGIEAGECVSRTRTRTPLFGWRAATAVGALSALAFAVWWINPQPKEAPVMRARKAEIRSTVEGLEVNENGGALVLLHGRGNQTPRTIIVSSPGTLRARYVDADTGQMTINNVYAE